MHSAHHRKLREGDAERLLGALAGVVSAHIVSDGAGRMLEIHILAAPDLHPKQVVRNVESALSAGLGIQVDRRVISVAQIRSPMPNGGAEGSPAKTSDAPDMSTPDMSDSEPVAEVMDLIADSEPAAPPAPGDERLEYVRYESHRDQELCRCQVLLRSPRGEVMGSGSGPGTAGGRAEAAARAVFDAIEKARSEIRIRLDGAVISQSRGRSFVIISANVVQDRATFPLAGAAVLSRSPEEAAILAALQASNRWSA